MTRGIIRFVPWWAIVLIIGLALTWTFRVNIAERAFSQMSHALNIDNTEIELKEINTSKVWLEKSRFTLSSGNIEIKTELVNAKIFYDLDKLYTGSVNKIEIEQATIEVSNQSGSQDEEIDLVKMLESITKLISTEFPITTVVINRLILLDGSDSLSKHSPVSLQIESISDSTHLQVMHASWSAFAHKTSSQVITSLADDSGNTVISLDSKIQQLESGGHSITVNLEAETKTLLSWWQEPTSLQNLTGLVNFDIYFESTEDKEGLFKFEITADKLKSPNFSSTQLAVSGSLLLPNRLNWENLKPIPFSNLDVATEELQSAEFSIYEPKITTEGIARFSDSKLSLDFSSNTVVEFDKLLAPLISIEKGAYSRGANYTHHNGTHTIKLLKDGRFQSKSLIFDPIIASDLDFLITNDVKLQVSSTKNGIEWDMHSGEIQYQDVNLALDKLTINASTMDLVFNNISPTTGSIELQSKDNNFNIGGQMLPVESLDLQMVRTDLNIQNMGSFSFAEIPIEYKYRAITDTQRNDTKFEVRQQSKLDLSLYGDEIKQLINSPELETLDFASGEGSLDLEGEWSLIHGMKINIKPVFTSLSGHYEDFGFQDGSIEGQITFPSTTRLAENSAHINVGQIESGVSIKNLGFDFNLVNTTNETVTAFEIRNFQGNIFGSEISAEDFVFDPNLDTNSMNLVVEGLDIEEVIELQEIDGLGATGKLDGILPIEIDKQGVRVSAGELHNQNSGGKISYQIEEGLKQSLSNPLTDAALEALSDFNYDILTADVNYEPSGDLMVNFHIEGTSPHLENSQPVHLNINTEQNVLSLLESLKYANSLNDEIDKNFQKGIPSSN